LEEIDQNQEVDEWLMLPGGSQETADSQKLKEGSRNEKLLRRSAEADKREFEGGGEHGQDFDDWMFKTFDPLKKEKQSIINSNKAQSACP